MDKILVETITGRTTHDGTVIDYQLKGVGDTLYLTKLKITKK